MYFVYWLIAGNRTKTYVGFTKNIQQRIKKHKSKQINSTKDFDKFRCFILEKVDSLREARTREKYWKSCAGRKKLRKLYNKAPSSSG